MSRTICFMAASAAFLIGGASVATAEQHEAAAWDQAKATELAGQLADAVKSVRDAQRNAPTPNVASGMSRAHARFSDGLRLIGNEAKHLAKQLQEGNDREATSPVYERLTSLIDGAREDARRMMLVDPVTQKIDAAREGMNQLRALYGEAPVSGLGR
jgi:hypothetical protein